MIKKNYPTFAGADNPFVFIFVLQRYNFFQMKKIIFYITFSVGLFFLVSRLQSCQTTRETTNCFPSTAIQVTLDLNLPAFQNLQNVGNWLYIHEQSSGTNGLIVVRTKDGFNIYDRNAPHLCPDGNNTVLKVVDNIKIVCSKDGAEWILLTGEMLKIATVPPKTYRGYSYNSQTKILHIYA